MDIEKIATRIAISEDDQKLEFLKRNGVNARWAPALSAKTKGDDIVGFYIDFTKVMNLQSAYWPKDKKSDMIAGLKALDKALETAQQRA